MVVKRPVIKYRLINEQYGGKEEKRMVNGHQNQRIINDIQREEEAKSALMVIIKQTMEYGWMWCERQHEMGKFYGRMEASTIHIEFSESLLEVTSLYLSNECIHNVNEI